MKATEQCFPLVLFIVLYKVALSFKFVEKKLWTKGLRMTFQMNSKALDQRVPAVLFVMLYKEDLIFESVVEILNCDIQIKVIAHYFPVVLFVKPHKMVETFELVHKH